MKLRKLSWYCNRTTGSYHLVVWWFRINFTIRIQTITNIYILPKCSFHITVARFAHKLVKLIPSAIFSCFRTNLWLVFLWFPISHLVLLLEIYDWLPFQSRIIRLLPFKVISHPQAMAARRKAGEHKYWNTWLPSKPLLQAGLISCLRLRESIKDSKNIQPVPFIWRLGCYQNHG